MPHARSTGSMRSTAERRTALLVVALLLTTQQTMAYNVRYSTMTSPSPQQNFNVGGYCKMEDPAAHSMMPKLQSFHEAALQAYKKAGFSGMAPIGGLSRQAACLDISCHWQFNHGLYEYNEYTFYNGIVYTDSNGVKILKGKPLSGVFQNFDQVTYPASWENASYFGKRQPVMMSDGSWRNIEITEGLTDWVCEYYEYTHSDSLFFPTYPNGDVMVPDPNNSSKFMHCGKEVKIDSRGRYIDNKCGGGLPWWGGLLIAVCITVVVFVVIIVVFVICVPCKNAKEKKSQELDLDTVADNPGRIPTQTNVGASRMSIYSSNDNGAGDEIDLRSFDGDGSTR